MSRLYFAGGVLILIAGAAGGCTSAASATDLNPAGPPMVRQVVMTEMVKDAQGNVNPKPALAFGHHPDFPEAADDGVVVAATVDPQNVIQVVVDELLLGNTLEQIQCNDGSYQSVPEGTTPDDIANCAVASDVLPHTCVGPHAVCLDANGKPVGVKDDSPADGAADDTQFMPNAAHITCGSIDVPLDLEGSYWQPAGDQEVPAAGGFGSVGPAIFLAPKIGLPTTSTCHIKFSSSVTDKDHNPICAPPGGDVNKDCPGVGDTSLIQFGTMELAVGTSNPPDGASNVQLVKVSLNPPAALIKVNLNALLQFDSNGGVDPAAFTLDEGGTPRTDIDGTCVICGDGACSAGETATSCPADCRTTGQVGAGTPPCVREDPATGSSVDIYVPGGMVANTAYTLNVTSSLKDQFGIPLPADQVKSIHWTTTP